MATAFQGVIEKGQIRWVGVAPPEGTLVVVVPQEPPSVDEQIKRLQAIPPAEWRKSFEAVLCAWDESEPAELEDQPLSDDELKTLIEQAREQVYAQRRR
jgi:hypothetical protein